MDAVAEIKRRLDLVEYIGRVTRLQKAGRNFRGLCPFHTEKTPSFYVFPDRGTWRCFGSCGEGGDLFSFVEKRDNVDFRDAMRTLAAEAGVELTPHSAAKRGREERLAGLIAAAVEYYQRCFREPAGAEAREYVYEKRHLSEEAVQAFRIGWAPDGWRGLHDFLVGRGYDVREAVAAGMLVEPENGGEPYDRFRGRVTIPIADERGGFVAMGGRGLHGEKPKYLNSPQTELFDKGRTLFGLDLAAKAIREQGVAVVVEGYMDVIGPWQAGFRNVVATMGTSLTEHHVALLRRFAKRVVLAMDPDAAGLAAAERAGSLFLGAGSPEAAVRSARSAEALTAGSELEIRVAPLPPGKDPDEIAHEDPEAWRAAIAEAAPFAEFLVMRLAGPGAAESPVEARRIVDRVRPVLLAVSDPVERGMYIQRVARHLGVGEEAVLERLRQSAVRARRPDANGQEAPAPEEYLLALLVRHPGLRSEFRHIPEHLFTRAVDREVFRRWLHEDRGDDENDPVTLQRRRVEALRLPLLSERQAAEAVRRKLDALIEERQRLHLGALTEVVADAEREHGAARVATAAHEAWLGATPTEPLRELTEAVFEDFQLGLSIHRREQA